MNDLCGSHTYQSVKPMMIYIDQLQTEQEKVNEMRDEIKQLKIAEGKLKDDLILSLQTAALSKDIHIKDLQTMNSELQNTNHILKEVVESVNNEIAQLKTLFKESLERDLTAIWKQFDNYNITFQNQLKNQNNTIVANDDTILKHTIQIQTMDDALKTSQSKVNDNQDILINHKDTHKQNDEEASRSCPFVGDSKSIYIIRIPNFESFSVLCNNKIAGPNWAVIQQRINGEEDFNRNWESYRNGFGSFTGDFFLGLERIHRLTSDQTHELYIHMERFDGTTFFARYDNFRIAGEGDKYRLLSLGSFSGNAVEDRMRYHEYQKFSTNDNDNDEFAGNCAQYKKGGWWYKKCFTW